MPRTHATADLPLSDYPTGDGKPMAETPTQAKNLAVMIQVLKRHYAGRRELYIAGNMMMYYVRNDLRRHVSPDVFVTFGIPDIDRDAYFTWVEGKGPDVVFEMTSKSTRREDQKTKFALYEQTLRVPEYFLFDPTQDYLKPSSMRGYRLEGGVYAPIPEVEGRLESRVLGLFLERQGTLLRLYNPATGAWVQTDKEAVAEARQEARHAQAHAQQVEARANQAEARANQAEEERQAAREDARIAREENARLARELEELRRKLAGGN